MKETEPTAFCPHPRRLECLTACRCHSKGSTFFSVILRPWVCVQTGSWTPTFRTEVRCSSTWANQAAVIMELFGLLLALEDTVYVTIEFHHNRKEENDENNSVTYTVSSTPSKSRNLTAYFAHKSSPSAKKLYSAADATGGNTVVATLVLTGLRIDRP